MLGGSGMDWSVKKMPPTEPTGAARMAKRERRGRLGSEEDGSMRCPIEC